MVGNFHRMITAISLDAELIEELKAHGSLVVKMTGNVSYIISL